MSEAPGDDEDLEPAPFILMRAEETFDGQERVMSRAAYDLQVRATVHSASCGHPGYDLRLAAGGEAIPDRLLICRWQPIPCSP
jgi:hypothetical protein